MTVFQLSILTMSIIVLLLTFCKKITHLFRRPVKVIDLLDIVPDLKQRTNNFEYLISYVCIQNNIGKQ